MAGVIVPLVCRLVEDAGEVPVECCICPAEASALETREASATHEVAAEVDTISNGEPRKQILQYLEGDKLQINL